MDQPVHKVKLIELNTTDDHTLFEYGNCRISVSKRRPLHVCIVAFRNGLPAAPRSEEISHISRIFFTVEGKNLPYIKDKMFTDTGLHLWEKTPFTQRILNE
jgi:hypothetical protein